MYRVPSPALPLSCLCQDSNAVVASMRNSSTYLENASISTRMNILQSQGAYVVQVVTLEWIVRGTGEGVRVYVELHLAGSSAGSMSTVKWMYWQHGHCRMNVMNFRYWGVVTTLELWTAAILSYTLSKSCCFGCRRVFTYLLALFGWYVFSQQWQCVRHSLLNLLSGNMAKMKESFSPNISVHLHLAFKLRIATLSSTYWHYKYWLSAHSVRRCTARSLSRPVVHPPGTLGSVSFTYSSFWYPHIFTYYSPP